MTLSDVILNPHSIAPHTTVYACWPWTPESEVLLQPSSHPLHKLNNSYTLFLEMKIILRLLHIFQSQNLCLRVCIEKIIEFAQQQTTYSDQT